MPPLDQTVIPGDDELWHHAVVTVTAAGDAAMVVDGSLVAQGSVGRLPTGQYSANGDVMVEQERTQDGRRDARRGGGGQRFHERA